MSQQRAVEIILSRLKRVRPAGANSFIASCPCPNHTNGDRNPSLKIADKGERVLLKCFSGGTPAEILQALGLEASDLFDRPSADHASPSSRRQSHGRSAQQSGSDSKSADVENKADDYFPRLPWRVQCSEAYKTLPDVCIRVLNAFLSQRSHFMRNGSGFLTFGTAEKIGITRKNDLADAFRELCARGILVMTRPGARPPMRRSALYGATWLPIAEPDPKDPHEHPVQAFADAEWAAWTAPLEMTATGWTVRKKRSAPKLFQGARRVTTTDLTVTRRVTAKSAHSNAPRTDESENTVTRRVTHLDLLVKDLHVQVEESENNRNDANCIPLPAVTV